jgi:protein-S-isoprenylcysteine O-methyltransferase Ste14
VRGLYRWVRNPMYLGVLLFLVGEVVFFREIVLLLYLLFVASAIQVFLLGYEEPDLRRRFGALYSDYCNVTPRWLPRRPKPALQTVPPFSPSR